MDSLPDITNDRIGGYRILRRLATGGTSDVLLARAEGPHGFGRTVVLKKLLAQFQSDPQFERMFAREAAAYARLSHPSIVKLYDFFSLDGQLVMVIEFIDGLPLNRLRAMLRGVGHSLDDRAAIYVATRVFAALSAAHAARDTETGEFAPVIHRDVNPSNVLIPWDGHVKLADFGIAKVAGLHSETQHGLIKGTYGYMAPEQVKGEALTVRADVYAGALMLWELLARRKAIQRGALPEMEVLRAMAEPHIVSLDILRPDVDPQVRDAVRRGLEPVADKRSITADEMLNVLKGAVKSEQGRQALVNAMSMVRPTPASDVMAPTESNPGVTAGQPQSENTLPETRSPLLPLSDNDVEALARAVVALAPIAAESSLPPPRVRSPSHSSPLDATRASTPGIRQTSSESTPRPPLTPFPKAPARPLPAARLTPPPGAVGSVPRAGNPGSRPPETGSSPPVVSRPTSTLRFEKVERLLVPQAGAMPRTTPSDGAQYPTTLSGTGAFTPNGAAAPQSRQSSVPAPRYNTVQASPPPPPPDAATAWPLARSGLPPPEQNPSAQAGPQPPGQMPSFDSTVASPAWSQGAIPPPPANMSPPNEPMGWLPTDPGGFPTSTPPPPVTAPMPPGMMMNSQHPPPMQPPDGGQRWQSQGPEAPLLTAPPAATGGGGRGRGLLIAALVLLVSSGGIAGALAWNRARLAKLSAKSAVTVTATTAGPASTTGPATITSAKVTPVVAMATATASVAAKALASASASASAAPVASAPAMASAVAMASAIAKPTATAPPPPKPTVAATAGAGGETGDVKTDTAASGRRVFVDGHVAGQTPETVHVRCGVHTVRVGSSGKEQSVDVPCGGEVSVK